MGMNLRAFLIFLLMPVLQAELPPSAYESMQAKAPEYLRIEVLRVNVEPGESPTQQRVHVVALTTEVFRTKSGLKPGEIVNILYTVTEHPQGWAGPGRCRYQTRRSEPLPIWQRRKAAILCRPRAG